MFIETKGQGTPMLLMHGGLGLDHSYLRSHDALSDAHRLIYYDHRGNGRSPPGTAPLDHAHWQDDAATVLDQVQAPRAIIYGHSYGSWLALGFALRYPERVAALVLCGTCPALDYMPDLSAAPPELVARFTAALSGPVANDDAFRQLWLDILPLYFHRYRPDYAHAFDDVRYSAAGYNAGGACIPTYNVVAQLPQLRAPTLILDGTYDFITPVAQARRIPGELVEFTGSGHFPFLEEADRYFGVLRDWLSRLDPALT